MKKIKPPRLSTAFSESGKSAKRRIGEILNTKTKRLGAGLAALALVFALAVGAAIACRRTTEAPPEADALISGLLLDESGKYADAEFWAEGHVILGAEEKGGKTEYYAVTSVGGYSFMNGMFIEDSGSGAIPAVITVSGGRAEIEYPKDGSYYADSIRKMFPPRFVGAALQSDTYYDELAAQKRAQAREYLKSIGREAEVGSYRDLDPRLPDMSAEASNRLLEMQKDEELNKFPMFIGSVEYLEDGARYTYVTDWNGDENGGVITYRRLGPSGEELYRRTFEASGGNVMEIFE